MFDVSQPNQPLLVGQLSGIGAGKPVAGNGVAYATANNNVIDVISIGAGAPQIVANIPSTVIFGLNVALAGNVLYAVGVGIRRAKRGSLRLMFPIRCCQRFVARRISLPWCKCGLGAFCCGEREQGGRGH